MFTRSLTRTIALLTIPVLLLTGLGCRNAVDPAVAVATQPFTLKIWGVFDDSDAYDKIIDAYKVNQPHVRVEYRKFRPEEYEQALLNALAEDQGPDIFMVRNTAIDEWENKILPLPDAITLPVRKVKGTVQKSVVTTLEAQGTISLRELRTNFVDVVADDVIRTIREPAGNDQTRNVERILGLPLSVDTLALFYNKTLLNRAGIAEAPKTWKAVQDAAKNTKLTLFDSAQRVTQAAISLGTTRTVERGIDILQLLMMQNGAQMATDDGNITFPNRAQNHPGELTNAAEATVFYTDFANPVKEVYTWNDTMPNSLDAFVGGRSAMFIGYNYHLPLIRARAPKFDFGIAPIPQTGEAISFANYWIHTVSRKSGHPDIAWDFVQFMASPDQVGTYLDATRKPTALRSMIDSQKNDEDRGVFAQQTLTAKSWYHGNDAADMEAAFRTLVTNVLADPTKVQQYLRVTAEQIAQSY